MAKAKIYTKDYCPYCRKAERLLSDAGIEYEEIDITNDPEAYATLKKQTGHMTVPQVFIDDEFIGGCDDLGKWLEKHDGVGKKE
ncbi:MAG: glutaredoxin domain-containing protein [Candidatus Woesearchaeota archaeon]